MSEVIQHVWNPKTIRLYTELGRESYTMSAKEALRSIMRKYVVPRHRILEVGSGLGEFLRLAPEYYRQVQQTDRSAEMAKANKAEDRNSNVAVADIYSLPFKSGSFDVVLGFSVFDTLSDMEKALKEVKRVIAPKGKFMHFLDLQACGNLLVEKYESKGYVAFPALDATGCFIVGVRVVPRDAVKQILDSVPPVVGSTFQLYLNDPVEGIITFSRLNRLTELALKAAAYFPNYPITVANETFFNDFKRALDDAGFITIEEGTITRSMIVARRAVRGLPDEQNTLHNDIGFIRRGYDREVEMQNGKDNVKVTSTLGFTVRSPA
ncbi:MAG: class I SAM-dependent methyltransferase [Candidatus Marsarchaeota archaeon]|nr:class I SAM-dependent methyltransferase [Candidatus Marsarchaeota archaeon]